MVTYRAQAEVHQRGLTKLEAPPDDQVSFRAEWNTLYHGHPVGSLLVWSNACR